MEVKKTYYSGNSAHIGEDLTVTLHYLQVYFRVAKLRTRPFRHVGSGGIEPCILNLGTKWKEVFGERHGPATLYLWERTTGTRWLGGRVGPSSCLDVVAKRKTLSG
jgi:hypothetical protein